MQNIPSFLFDALSKYAYTCNIYITDKQYYYMKTYTIDFKTLSNKHICGWDAGNRFACECKLVEKIKDNYKIILHIPQSIDVISDSFWKGFYSDAVKLLKSKTKIEKTILVDGDEFFKKSSTKNLTILENITLNNKCSIISQPSFFQKMKYKKCDILDAVISRKLDIGIKKVLYKSKIYIEVVFHDGSHLTVWYSDRIDTIFNKGWINGCYEWESARPKKSTIRRFIHQVTEYYKNF